MEKARIGIIGLGNQGSMYLKKLFNKGKIPSGEVTAVCDINPNKIKALEGELHGVKAFADYKDLLASGLTDGVIVAVPHYQHPEISIAAMEAGINVLCEKPAGVYTKQVKEMNAAAAKSDKLFAIMFNQRTNCVYRKMREMIACGAIGNIKRVNWIITNWYRSQSYYDSSSWRATWKGEGGGVLLNQCPHQLDLLQWVLGMMPRRIRSFCHFGKWHDIEVEDDVTAYLEYDNGATGVFVTSTADTPGTNRLEATGDGGKLVCESDELTYYRLEENERVFNASYTGGFGEPKCRVSKPETDGKNPQHAGIIENFAAAILGKEKLFVDGKEGLNGVEIMNAMLLSAFLDKTVELPVDDELYLAELNKRAANGREKHVRERVLGTEKSVADGRKL